MTFCRRATAPHRISQWYCRVEDPIPDAGLEPGNRDHLCEDGHELLDAEREAGKIEQPGLRAGVDKQIRVTSS